MNVTSFNKERSRSSRDLPIYLICLISKSPIARWAPVPLRLIVGYGFMEHGFAKLARGLDAFPAILQALGVPAPHLMGWLTILVEIVGGLAVLLGALVPLASIPMAAVLLVAMITVHLPYGFSSIKLQAVTAAGAQFGPPGIETDLLYLACLATLVLGGSGPLAIDVLLAKRREVARPSPRNGAIYRRLESGRNCSHTATWPFLWPVPARRAERPAGRGGDGLFFSLVCAQMQGRYQQGLVPHITSLRSRSPRCFPDIHSRPARRPDGRGASGNGSPRADTTPRNHPRAEGRTRSPRARICERVRYGTGTVLRRSRCLLA